MENVLKMANTFSDHCRRNSSFVKTLINNLERLMQLNLAPAE